MVLTSGQVHSAQTHMCQPEQHHKSRRGYVVDIA